MTTIFIDATKDQLKALRSHFRGTGVRVREEEGALRIVGCEETRGCRVLAEVNDVLSAVLLSDVREGEDAAEAACRVGRHVIDRNSCIYCGAA